MRQIDTIVLVSDIQKSKVFYSCVLRLEILHDWQSMVIFHNRLALHQADLLQPQDIMIAHLKPDHLGCGNLIIYLEVDDLHAEYQRIQSEGIEMVHGILDLPWQQIFRIKDPDGHIIEIGQKTSE